MAPNGIASASVQGGLYMTTGFASVSPAGCWSISSAVASYGFRGDIAATGPAAPKTTRNRRFSRVSLTEPSSCPKTPPSALVMLRGTYVNSYQATLKAEGPPGGSARADSTIELIERVKGGDADAPDQVFARYLPALRRCPSGRLPRWTPDLIRTDDLVQEPDGRPMRGLDR